MALEWLIQVFWGFFNGGVIVTIIMMVMLGLPLSHGVGNDSSTEAASSPDGHDISHNVSGHDASHDFSDHEKWTSRQKLEGIVEARRKTEGEDMQRLINPSSVANIDGKWIKCPRCGRFNVPDPRFKCSACAKPGENCLTLNPI